MMTMMRMMNMTFVKTVMMDDDEDADVHDDDNKEEGDDYDG